MALIGLISDTHGLLRPQAAEALTPSDLIIHAGDVGGVEILDHLRSIAPVVAVRGNVDGGAFGLSLPLIRRVECERAVIYVVHIFRMLDVAELEPPVHAVIYGHSHRPSVERRDGILFINPGSAGPRRFDLPVTVARLRVEGDEVDCELVRLES